MVEHKSSGNYWMRRCDEDAKAERPADTIRRVDRNRATKPPLDRDDIGYALMLILGWITGIGIILWRNWYALPASLGVVLMEAAFLTFFCITAWVSVRRK